MADIYKSKYTGGQIEEMLENASRVAKVEANPTGEATEVLTKITIGDKTYSIPEGTEGTVVQGNPSGDATVELTKLKIGDTIYSIPQGSGGGGGYDLTLNTGGGSITLVTIRYADGTEESNRTFTTTTTLKNVVAVVFSATSTAMGVDGAIIAKSYSPNALTEANQRTFIYFNVTSVQQFITTADGFSSRTQIIPVGKCTMEWSNN